MVLHDLAVGASVKGAMRFGLFGFFARFPLSQMGGCGRGTTRFPDPNAATDVLPSSTRYSWRAIARNTSPV